MAPPGPVAPPDALPRIARALDEARAVLRAFPAGQTPAKRKLGGDPVTEADLAVDAVLRKLLPRDGEAWLSEETADDPVRLDARRVWVVDPLDGTREFVQGVPEWCVAVALVEEGVAVAGGICNPSTDQVFLGALGHGATLNGAPARVSARPQLEGGLVLASRSESARGEWARYAASRFRVQAVGSVAYKHALVAAGLADATWTVLPKWEWDVAAGAAIITAAGGRVALPDGTAPRFNNSTPKVPGFVAAPPALVEDALRLAAAQRGA